MKTKAAILHEIDKPLLIQELEIPKLIQGQAMVKVVATGLWEQPTRPQSSGWKSHRANYPIQARSDTTAHVG